MQGVNKSQRYILACSGGPDSMALFHMLLMEKIDFVIAFVNYHKRTVSDDEERMVKKYAEEHGIDFFHADALKPEKKGNFQAWARQYRYDFFCRLAKTLSIKGVLVAHHLDDLLETYFFQRQRGGIYTFYGLKEKSDYKNIEVIRPLLNFRKKDLLEYCICNKVPYSIDESNLRNDYTRNKIRHNRIEKMTKEEIDETINVIDELNTKQKIKSESIRKYLLENRICLKNFLDLEIALQKEIIYEKLKAKKVFISGKELTNIIAFLVAKNNNEYRLKDLIIIKEYGYFEIIHGQINEFCYQINTPCVIENEYFFFDLRDNEDLFFIKKDSYPLTIKSPNKEEVVKIGLIHKKVNRLFIDEKISRKYRFIWPCIYDRNMKIIFFPRKEEIDCIDKNGNINKAFYVKTEEEK